MSATRPQHSVHCATIVDGVPELSLTAEILDGELVLRCRACGELHHPEVKRPLPSTSPGYSEADPRNEGIPGSDDPVNHPSHYTFGKYEVVDVIYDWQPPYPLDNVIKYVARAGKKGGSEKELEDLKKAQFYLNYYIAQKEAGE